MTMSPRTQSFLDRRVGDRRVGDHPVAGPAIKGALDATDGFGGRVSSINGLTTLTPIGKAQAIRDAVPGFLRDLVRGRRPFEKMRAETKARRAALQIPPVDPNDIRGAIQDAEIRSWYSGLPLHERQTKAMTTTDARILGAIVNLPDVAGLTGALAPLVEQVKQRYAELLHGEEFKSIEAAEAVEAEVTAAVQLATDEIRRMSGMHERDFGLAMESIEKQLAAPMLIKMKGDGRIMRVRPEKRGTWEFQQTATPDEIRDGILYDPDKPDGALAEAMAQ